MRAQVQWSFLEVAIKGVEAAALEHVPVRLLLNFATPVPGRGQPAIYAGACRAEGQSAHTAQALVDLMLIATPRRVAHQHQKSCLLHCHQRHACKEQEQCCCAAWQGAEVSLERDEDHADRH